MSCRKPIASGAKTRHSDQPTTSRWNDSPTRLRGGRRGWNGKPGVYFYDHTHTRVFSHLSSRCKYRSIVRRSSDARYKFCRRSSRRAPGPCTSLRNPTPCLPWVSGGFELLLGRQQSRRPGVVLRGRSGGCGGGRSIRGLRFSPPYDSGLKVSSQSSLWLFVAHARFLDVKRAHGMEMRVMQQRTRETVCVSKMRPKIDTGRRRCLSGAICNI